MMSIRYWAQMFVVAVVEVLLPRAHRAPFDLLLHLLPPFAAGVRAQPSSPGLLIFGDNGDEGDRICHNTNIP